MLSIQTWLQRDKIKELYLSGLSSQEIKDQLQLPVTVRTIQRAVKSMGVTRPMSDAFRNAIARGRVTYHKSPKPPKYRKHLNVKLRLQILERDNFQCVLCGNTAKEARLEIDHINDDPGNNDPENLRVLCEYCNKGKIIRG